MWFRLYPTTCSTKCWHLSTRDCALSDSCRYQAGDTGNLPAISSNSPPRPRHDCSEQRPDPTQTHPSTCSRRKREVKRGARPWHCLYKATLLAKQGARCQPAASLAHLGVCGSRWVVSTAAEVHTRLCSGRNKPQQGHSKKEAWYVVRSGINQPYVFYISYCI